MLSAVTRSQTFSWRSVTSSLRPNQQLAAHNSSYDSTQLTFVSIVPVCFAYHVAVLPDATAVAAYLLHPTCIAGFICTTAVVQLKSFKLLPEAVQLWQVEPACSPALLQSSATNVQICVMDSRAYAALTPGMETAEELDACTLLVNSQVCASLLEPCLQQCNSCVQSAAEHPLLQNAYLLSAAECYVMLIVFRQGWSWLSGTHASAHIF